MAWSDRTVNWILLLMLCLLVGGAKCRVEGQTEPAVSLKERGLVAGIVFLEFLGFHILMLLETPINDPVINGVQGRYFIPPLLAALLAVGFWKRPLWKRSVGNLFAVGMPLLDFAVIICIYINIITK